MGQAAQLGWDFSKLDWVECLYSGKSLLPSLPLDLKLAEQAVSVFNNLRIPDVPGQPLNSVASGEWQRDIVRAVFGSLMPDGTRKVKSCFCMVPKKNNKTTGGAAIMLTALLMNRRPRANFMIIGPSHEVALKAFDQAAGMIEADTSGYLQTRFQVQNHLKTIIDRRTKANLKVVTFDMKIATGSRPVGVLLDELHLMSNDADASRILTQITGGMITTPESFIIKITTQSDQEPAGVFKGELSLARAVRDGKVKGGNTLPLIYEFPEEFQKDESKPWLDPKFWPLVMPNLGLSYTLESILPEFEKAMLAGEGDLRIWASQHLNIQIGLAQFDGQWGGARYWLSQLHKDPQQITLESLLVRSEVVVVGGDAGGLDDLMGLAVIGRDKITKDWLHWCRAWVQDDVLEKRKEIAERLMDFVRDGDLTICSNTDPTQDVREFCDTVETVFKSGKMPRRNGCGLDPAGIVAIVDELDRRGIKSADKVAASEAGPITGVRQTATQLAPAIWGLERKLKDGTFWHAGQAIMAWNVSNAKTEQRGNAVLITKQTAGKAKIDLLAATLNAVTLMALNPEAVGDSAPSVYFL